MLLIRFDNIAERAGDDEARNDTAARAPTIRIYQWKLYISDTAGDDGARNDTAARTPKTYENINVLHGDPLQG